MVCAVISLSFHYSKSVVQVVSFVPVVPVRMCIIVHHLDQLKEGFKYETFETGHSPVH